VVVGRRRHQVRLHEAPCGATDVAHGVIIGEKVGASEVTAVSAVGRPRNRAEIRGV